MIIPTDHIELLRDLGAYAYAASTPAELADKLQKLQGSTPDRLFTAIELLYAFRDQLDDAGLTLIGQLTGFALANSWQAPGEPDRIRNIHQGVLRDVEGFAYTGEDPTPTKVYRADRGDWRESAGPNLDQLKAAKWKAVKELRSEKEKSTAPTPYGVAQIDDASKLKITGLVNMALIAQSNSQPFEEGWTMADNTVVTLDATMAITLGVAIGRHVSAVFERARVLRDLIDAVAIDETNADPEAALQDAIAALEAINVNEGWPASE